VAGVDQQQLQPALLQHLPARLPILAGRLQYDLRDIVVLEPLGEGLQTRAERRVGVHLLAARRRHQARERRPRPRPCRHPVRRSVRRPPPPSTPPGRVGKAPGRADRSGDAERRAHSNSSWCREGPRVSLINGLCCTKESRAWPGVRDSHPSWRPPAMRVLSAIEGSPLCNPPFSQVAADRRGPSNAFLPTSFQAAGKPDYSTRLVRDSRLADPECRLGVTLTVLSARPDRRPAPRARPEPVAAGRPTAG
jgi:hypothetical protein